MTSRLLVILPAYNEEANLKQTITKIRTHIPKADIAVINDGSTDNTPHVAQEAGAMVLNMPYNVGIGAAVQTGFQFAYRQGYEMVVRNDGDGQHGADGIKRLIQPLLDKEADVVIGSRFISEHGDYGTSLPRRMGISLLAKLLSLITHQPITDPTSGFCAFNRRAIQLFAQVYPHDYPEPEAVVIAHRTGLRLCEIPIHMQAREHGQSSITPVRSVYYMIKVTLAILINLLRRAPILEGDT